MEKNIVNAEKLRNHGYGTEAIESLEMGLFIAYWQWDSEEARQIEKEYPQYESFKIREYPDGSRYLFGCKDRTKTDADLLKELSKAIR
ncbi:MAG: hypothetical protein ACK5MJ_03535 [Alphaproteobacteria bacterium]